MKCIKRYFLSGLLFVAPVGLTLYIVYRAFVGIDGWLEPVETRLFGRSIPGVGFAAVLLAIFLIGFLASNFLAQWLFGLVGRLLERLPLVKLLYTSIRDLLNAFVGDKKGFDRPVLVRLFPGSDARVMGFITNDDLASLGLSGDVTVYVPQSYNFAGNLVVVPKESVTPIQADSGAVMKFIVSGGVSASGAKAGAEAGAGA